MKCSKVDFRFSFCCQKKPFLFLTLVNCHADNLSSFCHPFFTATFVSRIFIA